MTDSRALPLWDADPYGTPCLVCGAVECVCRTLGTLAGELTPGWSVAGVAHDGNMPTVTAQDCRDAIEYAAAQLLPGIDY